MTDTALLSVTQALTQLTLQKPGQFIWCTDENSLYELPTANAHPGLLVLTNRWDVAQVAQARGYRTNFTDFDCSQIADNSLDGFFYRISKEKPLVHHLLNHAWRCLKPGAPLVIAGHKNEGIKTFIEKITALMGAEKHIEKEGTSYSSMIHKCADYSPTQALDDSDYTQLRAIAQDSGLNILSKPGLFGWNKIDAGSALLIEQLRQTEFSGPLPKTCLDLGCGYGYLTLAAARLPRCREVERWLLTDNNAAALRAAQYNLYTQGLHGEVIPADAGSQVQEPVELMLCNPPFHQGFSVDGDLTDKFLRSAHRLLQTKGEAFFVVNQFIPLERKAADLFHEINLLVNNGSFKVIRLAAPRRNGTR